MCHWEGVRSRGRVWSFSVVRSSTVCVQMSWRPCGARSRSRWTVDPRRAPEARSSIGRVEDATSVIDYIPTIVYIRPDFIASRSPGRLRSASPCARLHR